jgi:hypothetical protein
MSDINFILAGKCWLLSGYGYSPGDPIEGMDTPAGSSEILIGSTVPDQFSGSLLMNAQDHALFAGWLRHGIGYNGRAIAGGLPNKWFNTLVGASGTVEMREVRFIRGSIQYDYLGAGWVRVSAQFRTRTGTEMSADEYETVAGIGGGAYNEMMLAAAIAANTEIEA